MKFDIKKEKKELRTTLEKVNDYEGLERINRSYLGQKGKIKRLTKMLIRMPKRERIRLGREINSFKNFVIKEMEKKKEELDKRIREKEREEFFDITLPGGKIEIGHLHPISIAKMRIIDIFQRLGFEVVEGPEIEDEWHNFDALNIPPTHPARDVLSLGKTFFIKNKKLMRSHTSSVQIRYLEKNNPPLRIIVPGRVFRAEATDASHEIDFWQLEGLMVDKDVSVANFRAIMEAFFKEFFQKALKIRLRPSYFPFTEPSFEVDIFCILCNGQGCSSCKKSGWIEIAGAGMVHPNVFKNCKLNPKDWQGFAFGLGLNRLLMIKHKIPDIRLFNSGDLRFITQF